MGLKKNEKIEKWIDLSQLPRSKSGNLIRWNMSIGCTMNFIYGQHSGNLTIIDKLSADKYKVLISTKDDSFEYILNTNCIYNCKLGGAFTRPIAITNPELIKYFANIDDAYKYTSHSGKRVDMICPFCGTHRIQVVRVLTDEGLACPACSDGISFPNKLMYNILTQLQVDFINEVTHRTDGFDWISNDYRYDFYVNIPNDPILIEMDGRFHTGSFFQTYTETHETDVIKDLMAKNNGFRVIRIDCAYCKMHDRFEYVQNSILSSELNYILNLHNVDWNKAYTLASTSNVKLAADLWNTTDFCSSDIAKHIGVSVCTARSYLTQAAKLKLCDYNSKKAAQRTYYKHPWSTPAKNNKNKVKPIALYKDGDLLNVFLGVVDLDRQSEALYGVHMDYRNVYAVCKGDRKHTYGYTMKFITHEEYERLAPQLAQTVQN